MRHTWRSRENGKHEVNVSFDSMSVMKDMQLVVILLLNPMSKGTGKSVVAIGATEVDALEEVEVVAEVDMVDDALVDFVEASSSRRLR